MQDVPDKVYPVLQDEHLKGVSTQVLHSAEHIMQINWCFTVPKGQRHLFLLIINGEIQVIQFIA